ncbi:MAG: AAA family ATPase, partial [Chloroflexales bacterium]|nr:AAA family ATPase [Chloroflexales bacterium]
MSNSALAPTLIGRQPQLAALRGHFAQARAGVGQVVLLAGEAGVGKTRLLREFAQAAAAEGGVAIYSGHCYDERPAPPYGPFAELLRRLGEAAEPALGDIRAPADGASGDPHAERRLRFHAIYQALRPPDARTHLLFLEDLHWADQTSQDLLFYLARAIEADRILIIGTYRTDEMHRLHPLAGLIARLTRDRRHHEVRLAPLSRAELAEMLAATLGAEPSAELVSALYERTEGNPFFAEELLGALLADGALPGPAARALDAALPLSIRESILRRAADLDEPTRAAMSAAAVIGRRFDFELLLRLTGMEEVALLRCLSALVERQLIAEEPGGPEDRYSFRHELIRAVLYEEMLRRERRLRHHEVLRALEDLHRADPAAAIDQLAYHALMARALPEAARYSELAGDRAARVHAYREALGHYEVALEAGEQTHDDTQRAGLLARLGHAAYQVGEPRRAAGYWREALPIYEAMGDRRRAGDLQRWLGRTAWELRAAEEAFARTRAAIAALEGEGPCRELAMAYSALAHIYMLGAFENQGHAVEAIAWGEKALAMGEALGDDQVVSHALNNIGVAMDAIGQGEAGVARLERSLEVALAADLPADAVRAYINLGGRMHEVGINQRVLELGRQGWGYAARHGYIHGSATLLLSLCWSELEAGEWQILAARLDEVLRPGFPGPQDERPMLLMIKALLLAEHDRLDEARDLLESALAAVGDPEKAGSIEHALTQVYSALGDQERAVAVAASMVARVRARAGAEKPLSCLGLAIFDLAGAVRTFLKAGRRDEVLAILAQMEAVAPAAAAPRKELALIEELRGWAALDASPAQAAAWWARAITLNAELGYRPAELSLRRERTEALLRLETAEARVRETRLSRTASASRSRARRGLPCGSRSREIDERTKRGGSCPWWLPAARPAGCGGQGGRLRDRRRADRARLG